MPLTKNSPKKIVLFASGNGTNAVNLINYFNNGTKAKVCAVFSNKASAPVLEKAHDLEVKALCFDREAFYKTHEVLNILKDINPDLIVLAGFLWAIPKSMLQSFPNKIVNIHPALLPKYGGKGMYGKYVHQAVKKDGETETGISIHYVNEEYDEGKLIFQEKTLISDTDSVEDIIQKVHLLEYEHFPKVVEKLLFPEK